MYHWAGLIDSALSLNGLRQGLGADFKVGYQKLEINGGRGSNSWFKDFHRLIFSLSYFGGYHHELSKSTWSMPSLCDHDQDCWKSCGQGGYNFWLSWHRPIVCRPLSRVCDQIRKQNWIKSGKKSTQISLQLVGVICRLVQKWRRRKRIRKI